MSTPFRIYAALTAFEKAGDEHPMRIGGIVSTDELDLEDEVLVQEGLDFSPFLSSGWFNDNHSKSMGGMLGYPTDAYLVKKGQSLPNGDIAKTKGWWAEGYLLDTQKGRETWDTAVALQNTPRCLAFSIEGDVTKRDSRNRLKVLKGTVKHTAITHIPVNTGTQLTAFAKALTAGNAADSGDLNQGPGDAGALRAEDLDGVSDTQAADKKKKSLSPGAIADDVVGYEETIQDADGQLIAKAGEGQRHTTLPNLFEDWGEAVGEAVAKHPAPTEFTKSEAQLIVAACLPPSTAAHVADSLLGSTP